MPNKFAAAINCMDGRVQEPVIRYLVKTLSVKYVDMVTEPGPDKLLSENRKKAVIRELKRKARISCDKHGSRVLAVVGHHDCASNPAGAKKHQQQVKQALETVRRWKLPVEVIGLWVNGQGKVERVDDRKTKTN